MKEIGGYFQLDRFVRNPYYRNMIELNTGSNALLYLIKCKNIRKIYIPYYLCDSISKMLINNSIDFEYYHINKYLIPELKTEIRTEEYIYIVNYFGQVTNKEIIKLRNKYQNIIIDNTQAFFQKPVSDIDTIYSCRKYFGVPDGAYLSTNDRIKEELEKDKSSNRMTHILGRCEGETTKYYEYFQLNNKILEKEPLKRMSNLTKNILGAIDYNRIKRLRNTNFNYLHQELKATNKLVIKIPEGPYAYPYYVKNGIEIRKKLSEMKIYIPTLWPNVLEDSDKESIEYDYVSNILALPCDQRWTIEDMDILVNKLRKVKELYG